MRTPEDGVPKGSESTDTVSLRSLGAEYKTEHHGVYVRALRRAIENEPKMRNIALTGAYGTGKSSVLNEIARLYQDRVLELSLSSVGTDVDDTTHGGSASTASKAKTNHIQKEIVKQILYRDSPTRTQGSRFRRIARFRLGRELGVGIASGAVVLALLFLSGLSQRLVVVASGHPVLTALAYIALLVLLAVVIVAVRWATHNRVFLEKLSAGPATVSLASTQSTTSYFDQYMDEIVYYFEQSGRDIVIFEDIDRFEDVHIFETLRALNTLLNGAEQVRFRRGHSARQQKISGAPAPPVKFIYALRDSVFEKLGEGGDTGLGDAAADEVKRANRTKFFDLVIPVVPFITHRNARDLMSDEMNGTGVSPALTDLAARHVADKRLIVNMRNEYDVFADRLLHTENRIPSLDEDRLFAMILYKSVHMADFEAIRFGTSQLDLLHAAWQDLIEHCVDALTAQARDIERRIAILDSVADRSTRLGERLRMLAVLSVPPGLEQYLQIHVAGEQYDADRTRTAEFWQSVVDEHPTIQLGSPYGHSRTVTFDELKALMGQDLDSEKWERQDRAQLVQERDAISEKLGVLRHHSWQEIYARRDLTADLGHGAESFRDLTRRLLRSDLARDLVADGFINDYFALYISMYYGRHLRIDALNFVVHALDRGEPNMLYPLEPEDVEAILKDKGEGVLRDPSIYNVAIMDHLLAPNDERGRALAHQIAVWGDDEQAFAARYLANGSRKKEFIGALAPHLRPILTYLISEARLDATLRVELVDRALGRLHPANDYAWDDDVVEFVTGNYKNFPTLTDRAPAPSPTLTTRAMSMLAAMRVRLPSLTALNPAAREAAVDGGTYVINAENLRLLAGGDSIALDMLRVADERVYRTTLDRLAAYVEVVRATEGQHTVEAGKYFLEVLKRVAPRADVDDSVLADLVDMASKDCRVSDLQEAPPRTWPVLATAQRIDPTAANLVAYLESSGAVDEPLAALLTGVNEVLDVDQTTEAARAALALTLINADTPKLTPEQKTRLVVSLGLEDWVDVADLTFEGGPLVGLLIEAEVIADNKATFSSPLIPDWATREVAIEKSEKFLTFLSTEVLPASDVAQLFISDRIPGSVKDAVLERAEEFIPGGGVPAADAAAHYALARRAVLSHGQLATLRAEQLDTASMVNLIALATNLSNEELRGLLRSMGPPYATIADPGHERPLVPNDSAHRAILERLHEAGVVSKHVEEKGQRRVSLFHHLNA